MNIQKRKVEPVAAYQAALDSGQLQSDSLQREVVDRLQDLYVRLLASEETPQVRKKQGGFFSNLFKRAEVLPETERVTGLYLWGGVGRGKTLLCDMFYAGLPTNKKRA